MNGTPAENDASAPTSMPARLFQVPTLKRVYEYASVCRTSAVLESLRTVVLSATRDVRHDSLREIVDDVVDFFVDDGLADSE